MECFQRNTQAQRPVHSEPNRLAPVQDHIGGENHREQDQRAHPRMGPEQACERHTKARPGAQRPPSLRDQIQSHQRRTRQHDEGQRRARTTRQQLEHERYTHCGEHRRATRP